MTDDRSDRELGAALRRLEPPDHRPGFWDELTARLDAAGDDDPGAARPDVVAGADHEVPVLADRRQPPRRGLGPLLLAAAAVVVAVGLGVALLRPDGTGSDVDVVDDPGVGTTTTTTVDEEGPSLPDREDEAVEVARAWIEALGTGDRDTAWALLAEPSREALGGRAGFEAETGLSEGYGAWAGADEVTYRATALSADAVVVTITGTVVQEGMEERRAAAVPLVADGTGDLRAAPLDPGRRRIELDAVPAGTAQPVPLGVPVLHATVPDGADAVVVADGEPVVRATGADDGGEALRIDLADRSGEEVALTVAAFLPDGAAVATGVLVEVP